MRYSAETQYPNHKGESKFGRPFRFTGGGGFPQGRFAESLVEVGETAMTNSEADTLEDLPLATLQEVDQLCESFEAFWASGETPSLNEYLAAAPASNRGCWPMSQ